MSVMAPGSHNMATLFALSVVRDKTAHPKGICSITTQVPVSHAHTKNTAGVENSTAISTNSALSYVNQRTINWTMAPILQCSSLKKLTGNAHITQMM